MHKIFIFLLFLSFPALHWAQTTSVTAENPKQKAGQNKNRENERFFLGGSIGASIPFGNYYKTDPGNSKSGFARTGFLAQVNFDWMGKRNLGISIGYTYQHNALESSAKSDTLQGRTFPLGSGSWSNHYLMIGPVYVKQIGKFMINARVMGGVVLAFSTLFNYTSPDSLHQTVTNYGSGFAYEVAASGGYSVSSKVFIKLGVGLLGGIPTLHKKFGGEVIGTQTYHDPITGQILYSYTYAPIVNLDLKNYISTFNVSAGIVIKL